MVKDYPVESLLRPAMEWYSAVAAISIGTFAAIAPEYVWLTPHIGQIVGTGLIVFGIKRFYEGYQVKMYQKRLQLLPSYSLSSREIPVKSNKLFLGKGFTWQSKHTQRLYDLKQPETAKLFESKYKTDSNTGGSSFLHAVEPKEKDVWMELGERVGHMLVLGATRVGKTRLLEILVTQDIAHGETVIVFDPKGDAELLRRMVFEAKRANREDDLIIFHLGFPEISARYNPIANFARVTEVANRIANQLPGSGESAAFKEFGWRFVNIIAQALVALGRTPDYQQIQRYIINIEPLLKDYCEQWLPKVDPNWLSQVKMIEAGLGKSEIKRSSRATAIVKFIEDKHYYDAVADGLISAFNYDRTYFDKITASLLPLLEKLTTGRTAELICPDYNNLEDERPVFDWLQVIRGKKIVYVGLDALSDQTVASAIGNVMFSDLCSVAGQLYKYGVSVTQNTKSFHPVCIHSDEFNELIGDDFIPLINKAGGADFRVTAYTQTWSDVQAVFDNKAKAGQVGGNFNNLICMRVLEPESAELITSKLPQKVNVKSLVQVSSVSDTPDVGTEQDFSSNNSDQLAATQMPLLSADDLIQLPKGQAFALLSGGHLLKLRIPLPKDDMNDVPENVPDMVRSLHTEHGNEEAA